MTDQSPDPAPGAAGLRHLLEATIELLLDQLDTLDGDPDFEPDADAEPGGDREAEGEI